MTGTGPEPGPPALGERRHQADALAAKWIGDAVIRGVAVTDVELLQVAHAGDAEHDVAFHAFVENTGKGVAFLTRLRLVKGKDSTEILPIFWDDNYISLLPGERREVTVRIRKTDLASAQPTLIVDGFNVAPISASESKK